MPLALPNKQDIYAAAFWWPVTLFYLIRKVVHHAPT